MDRRERELTIAKQADLAAWEELQKAKAEMDAASFNLGDDLDRLAAAAEKLQRAAQELKLMHWRLDFTRHMAERDRAVALDYDDEIESVLPDAATCAKINAQKPVPQYRNSQGQIVYDIDPDAPGVCNECKGPTASKDSHVCQICLPPRGHIIRRG